MLFKIEINYFVGSCSKFSTEQTVSKLISLNLAQLLPVMLLTFITNTENLQMQTNVLQIIINKLGNDRCFHNKSSEKSLNFFWSLVQTMPVMWPTCMEALGAYRISYKFLSKTSVIQML